MLNLLAEFVVVKELFRIVYSVFVISALVNHAGVLLGIATYFQHRESLPGIILDFLGIMTYAIIRMHARLQD